MALKTSLDINYTSDIAKGAKKDARAMQKMGKETRKLKTSLGGAGLGNFKAGPISGLTRGLFGLTGAVLSLQGVMVALKQAQEIRSLRVQFNLTRRQERDLEDKIAQEAISNSTSLTDATSFTNQLANSTGEVNFTKDVLGIGLQAAKAVGVDPRYIGEIIGALFDQGIKDPEVIRRLLAQKIIQGKTGSVSLAESAPVQGKLIALAAGRIQRDPEEIAEYEALFQVLKSSFGSEEETVTALKAIQAGALQNLDILKKLGVKVLDEDGAFNDITDFLDQIHTITDGFKPEILKKLGFSETGLRAITALGQGGKYERAKDLIDVEVDTTQIAEDARLQGDTGYGALTRFGAGTKQAFGRIVDSVLDPSGNYKVAKEREAEQFARIDAKHGDGYARNLLKSAMRGNNTYIPKQDSTITVVVKADAGVSARVQGTNTAHGVKVKELNVGRQ